MQKITGILTSTMLGSVSFLSTTSTSVALEPNLRSQIVEKVGNYVEAVGCSYEADNQDDLLIADLGVEELEGSTYVAFPMYDEGCVGGSGTIFFSPVVLKASKFGSQIPYVDIGTTAEIDFINMPARSLEAVEVLTADRIRIVGYEYGEDDPMCCPSKRVDRVYKRYWGRGQDLWVPELD